jgi:transcription elongation factor GreA
MNKFPMTAQGAASLQNELARLKTVERPTVIQAISEARAHGDLKENAEYHAAKEQQGFIEARIRDIESKLSNPQIIDVTKIKNEGKVIFGATVKLNNMSINAHVVYRIVGEDEADIKQGKISVSSPIARTIIGKYVDDDVLVSTPGGEVEYYIESVDYI